jgi:radical SAM superfamily enzyme with C-terminal helix-hairpin-helix motif
MSSKNDRPRSAFRVITAGIAWRLFGSRKGGSLLLKAMAADDEQNRMLAGMSLVKAGDRSFRLIESEINNDSASAALIRLLPEIGGEDARRLLEGIAAGGPHELAEAATECIDLLDRMNSI